jgi:hypothetical protein
MSACDVYWRLGTGLGELAAPHLYRHNASLQIWSLEDSRATQLACFVFGG